MRFLNTPPSPYPPAQAGIKAPGAKGKVNGKYGALAIQPQPNLHTYHNQEPDILMNHDLSFILSSSPHSQISRRANYVHLSPISHPPPPSQIMYKKVCTPHHASSLSAVRSSKKGRYHQSSSCLLLIRQPCLISSFCKRNGAPAANSNCISPKQEPPNAPQVR